MRRGISPVITSTLLVLISISIVALLYPWATAATTTVANTIYRDARIAEQRIKAEVEILTPSPENIYGYKSPVVIHNIGLLPLRNVRVWYTEANSVALTPMSGIYVDVNGNTTSIDFSTGPLKTFDVGEALVLWLPEANSYYGYTILVTSEHYEKSVTIGAPG